MGNLDILKKIIGNPIRLISILDIFILYSISAK